MPAVTATVPGEGTSSLAFTVPNDGMDISAVYAEVDATAAGGAVTAEIIVQDQSGVVIARKVQGSTIDAGVAGSATWALRLDDEGGGGSGGGVVASTGYYTLVTKSITGPNAAALDFAYASGAALLDLTAPAAPTILTAGVYMVCVTFRIVIALGGTPTAGSAHTGSIVGWGGQIDHEWTWKTAAGTATPEWVQTSPLKQLAAGTAISLHVQNGDSTNSRTYDSPSVILTKLAN